MGVHNDPVVVVDIDGTLARHRRPDQSYAEIGVNEPVLARLQQLKRDGYWVILATSRNMRTHDGNIGLIMKHTAPVLLEWLHRHDVPYDEIHFGKPWCGNRGYYVDDRAIRPREFVELNDAEIGELLQRDGAPR